MRLWHQKLIPYLDRQRLLGNLLKEKNAPIDFKKVEEEILNGNNL